MRRCVYLLLAGLALLPSALLSAPPELTGVGGDGRLDADSVFVRSPWWLHTELLVIIGVLLVVLVAVSAWNRSIRIVARRQAHRLAEEARRLAQEEIAHARTRLKVEERTELAVEIHDSVSQALTGIALQLEAALATSRQDPARAEKSLMTASQMLASCRHELRGCLWDLRTRTFEERDLTEALVQTLAPHLKDVRAHVRFNVSRNRLSESTTHAILKIVRELTVNAIQHGRATTLRIAGEMSDGAIQFSVTDNGCGFDAATAPGPRDGHFGLQGIRERLRKCKGTLTFDSGPSGTRVAVTMPQDLEEEDP